MNRIALISLLVLLLGSVDVHAVRYPPNGGVLKLPAPPTIRLVHHNGHLRYRDAQLLSSVVEPLFRLDRRNRPKPHLVADFGRFEPENNSITLTIRQGVRFSNGRELSAARVRRTLMQLPDWLKHPFRRVEVVGKRKLKLQLRYPTPHVFHILSYLPTAVVATSKGLPVGTGPYRISRSGKGRQLNLLPNGFHFRGAPYLDQIRFLPQRGKEHEIDSFYLNQIDLSYFASPIFSRKRKSPKLVSAPMLSSLYLLFNPRSSGVQSVSVRRAIWRSINLVNLRRFLPHPSRVPQSILPPTLSGRQTPRLNRGTLQRRPRRVPTRLVILFDKSKSGHRAIAKAILTDLNSRLRVQEIHFLALGPKKFLKQLRSRKGYDCALVEQHFLTRSPRIGFAALVERLSPGTFLYKKTHNGRKKLRTLIDGWFSDLPLVPLLHFHYQLYVNQVVHRFRFRPDGLLDFFNMWTR